MPEMTTRPALRNITIKVNGSRKAYTVNGLEHNQATVAKLIHASSGTITARYRNNSRSEVARWLQVKFWIADMGLASKTSVFRRGDKLVLLTDIKKASGVAVETARGLGYQWQAEKISYEKMMCDRTKEGKVNANGSQSRYNLKGMQPRKNVCDLQPVGTMEKKYLNPESFSAVSHDGVVECGGNHYMGRQF